MKKNYFLHNMVKHHYTLSPYPIWLAIIKPFKIVEAKMKWACDDDTLYRDKKTRHSGPLIMRSRRWKYFANGEFYLLYSRRHEQGVNGLTPEGKAGMTDARKKWARGHLLPSKVAPRQAEGYHD